jgi:hypothetical protein
MDWKVEIKPSKVKNTLALHISTNSLIRLKATEIKNIPNYRDLKLDKELTKKICKDVSKFVDNDKSLTYKQKKELSKTNIVIEIMNHAFDLNETEIEELKKDIMFLFNNNLIKKKLLSSVSKALSKIF